METAWLQWMTGRNSYYDTDRIAICDMPFIRWIDHETAATFTATPYPFSTSKFK